MGNSKNLHIFIFARILLESHKFDAREICLFCSNEVDNVYCSCICVVMNINMNIIMNINEVVLSRVQ